MHTVVGVSFKEAGKIYYFDPQGREYSEGDAVIVETASGLECGEVVTRARTVSPEEVALPLKNILRLADTEDTRRLEENILKEQEALEMCQKKLDELQLEMKLVAAEYTFDRSRVVFYFTSEGRVDFRELVRKLASALRTRIEMHQIGVRDEAKMIGGLGVCGRSLCCATFLHGFQPVSIKMAKEQNLPLNPAKISGMCGRLMCCLNYENAYYKEVKARLPRVGSQVETEDGPGVIVDINVPKESVTVRLAESGMVEVSADSITCCAGGGCSGGGCAGKGRTPAAARKEPVAGNGRRRR